MSLADEVAAEIRTVIADLGYLRGQLDTALHDIERAGQGFAQAGRGTTTDRLPQAVTACGEAAERIVAAMGAIDQARELLWNYLLLITPSLAGPRPTAAPAAVAPEPAPYIGSLFDGLRIRQSPRDPTDGILTASDGQFLAGVYSGKKGPGAGGPGLRYPWKNAETTLAHAEGHAAAVIRARGITSATLYVNNTPCSGPAGCDRLLPDALPAGATLTGLRTGRVLQGLRRNGKGAGVKVHVHYDRHGPVVIETMAELDGLLDQIAANPEYQKDPVVVDVSDETEQRVLEIGLGYPTFSMVLWFDWNDQTPEACVSTGTITPAGYGGYNHGGTWTEYDADCAVPLEVARRAAREFGETGARPTAVEWRNPD